MRMIFDWSSVTRIGSPTLLRIRFRRSRSRVASCSVSRARWYCRSSSIDARLRSVTSRSTDTNAPSRATVDGSGCASTSNSRSVPSSGSTRLSSRADERTPPEITAFERKELNRRLLISTARRRPSESRSELASSISARRFCTTTSLCASVMTMGSGSALMIALRSSCCSSSCCAE